VKQPCEQSVERHLSPETLQIAPFGSGQGF
jgi:hypothetical protein